MTNGRTPAPTDRDGALDFGEQKVGNSNGTITLYFQGVPMAFNVSDKTIGQIERWITGMLARGWTAPPQPRVGGFGGKPDNRVDAAFDEDGNEVCPVHKTRVREYKTQDGRTFKGCPSKGTGVAGERLNQRGYCEFRFK
jgi:hypothetical protein